MIGIVQNLQSSINHVILTNLRLFISRHEFWQKISFWYSLLLKFEVNIKYLKRFEVKNHGGIQKWIVRAFAIATLTRNSCNSYQKAGWVISISTNDFSLLFWGKPKLKEGLEKFICALKTLLQGIKIDNLNKILGKALGRLFCKN